MAQRTDTAIFKVPEYFYAVDINYLTHMIADMLGRLISHNDLIPLTPSNLTRFHSRTPPNISLSDYLRRIVKYTSVEKSCLLILLIYIDRICESHPHFTISSLTVHRFLITAITVSSKALCDSYCTNSHYAKVGGLSTQELNALELEFLALIDWHLASSGLVLQQYYANLVQQHPCYERVRSEDDRPEETRKRRRSNVGNVGDEEEDEEEEDNVGEQYDISEELSDAISDEEEIARATACVDDDEETVRHFDELLDMGWVPYIA
ncbi:cyclin-domain-containing protein [Phycomyces nitens]|nr:cyclin-domain-containing protein [Phycomyces nitens]